TVFTITAISPAEAPAAPASTKAEAINADTSLRMFSSCYRALGSTLAGMLRIPSPLSAAVAHLVDPYGDQNDKADDDLLRESGNAVHVEAVPQDADDERADDRARDRADAADERRAADDRARDGVKLIGDAFIGLCGDEAGHQNAARQTRQRAGNDIGESRHAGDIDAG